MLLSVDMYYMVIQTLNEIRIHRQIFEYSELATDSKALQNMAKFQEKSIANI